MSVKTLTRFKRLIDRIATAAAIGPTECEAVTEELDGSLTRLWNALTPAERREADGYLDAKGADVCALRESLAENREEDGPDGDYGEGPELAGCDCEECAAVDCCKPSREISRERRRDLTLLALATVKGLEDKLSPGEYCFFIRQVDVHLH